MIDFIIWYFVFRSMSDYWISYSIHPIKIYDEIGRFYWDKEQNKKFVDWQQVKRKDKYEKVLK